MKANEFAMRGLAELTDKTVCLENVVKKHSSFPDKFSLRNDQRELFRVCNVEFQDKVYWSRDNGQG